MPLRTFAKRLHAVWSGSILLFACLGSFWGVCGLLSATPLTAQDAALPAGVSLPTKGSSYAIQAGQLVQLHAVEIMSNSHAAGNFARSMVYTGPRASVELDGLNAGTHLRGKELSFLVRLSDEQTDIMRSQLALVRLRQVEKRRVVSTFSQNIFGGQHKREYDIIPVTKVDIPDANWIRLIPVQPLGPGEYGLITIPKDPNLFSETVYDFDVDLDKAHTDAN